MKKLITSCCMWLCYISWGYAYPNITISFPTPPPATIFCGETVRIPVQMKFDYLRGNKRWTLPAGSKLENISGTCPKLISDTAVYKKGTCNMALIITGEHFGLMTEGALHYHLQNSNNKQDWEQDYFSPAFSVSVIPHNLSMAVIQHQEATASLDFVYNLKSAITYYDENIAAGAPIEVTVSPEKQNGLSFDPQQVAVVGKPSRSGIYVFKVAAKNRYSTTEPTTLTINVSINPKDKPVFKTEYPILSASPGQKYSLDLSNLLESNPDSMKTNQIQFSLSANHTNPKWLQINPEKPTFLEGTPEKDLAGQTVEATIIARSNTGGESEPYTITIPIAHDREKRPIINPFEMEQLAGNQFYVDLSSYIQDPANDPNLKIVLDKIEPETSKIKVSDLNPKMIEGYIADKFVGQKYLITLHANTPIGGDSESITIPLQISIDKSRRPRFKSANPILPIIYPGQSFNYDFLANRDVYPEYEDSPYEIQFADNEHPDWLKLEDNKLLADAQETIEGSRITFRVIINNIPGGSSGEITLRLKVAN